MKNIIKNTKQYFLIAFITVFLIVVAMGKFLNQEAFLVLQQLFGVVPLGTSLSKITFLLMVLLLQTFISCPISYFLRDNFILLSRFGSYEKQFRILMNSIFTVSFSFTSLCIIASLISCFFLQHPLLEFKHFFNTSSLLALLHIYLTCTIIAFVQLLFSIRHTLENTFFHMMVFSVFLICLSFQNPKLNILPNGKISSLIFSVIVIFSLQYFCKRKYCKRSA